jgi:hypothetical protein
VGCGRSRPVWVVFVAAQPVGVHDVSGACLWLLSHQGVGERAGLDRGAVRHHRIMALDWHRFVGITLPTFFAGFGIGDGIGRAAGAN